MSSTAKENILLVFFLALIIVPTSYFAKSKKHHHVVIEQCSIQTQLTKYQVGFDRGPEHPWYYSVRVFEPIRNGEGGHWTEVFEDLTLEKAQELCDKGK